MYERRFNKHESRKQQRRSPTTVMRFSFFVETIISNSIFLIIAITIFVLNPKFISHKCQMVLKDFTFSNARPFYLSMGNPSGVKGLRILRMDIGLVNITWISLRYWRSQKYLGIPWFASSCLWAYSVNPSQLTIQVLCGTVGWLSEITIIFEWLILNFQPLARYLGLFLPFSFLFPFCCNFAFTAVCVLFSRNIWQLRKLWRIK